MNETAKPQCAPLSGVAEALRRAALRARELARQTHTPVVVYRNGKVQSQIPDASAAAGGAEPRQG
ncbi:MAG: hypothetical protein KUL79_02115 [Thauera sp.]|nr:hypothetical protein [Thauera sp.]